MWTKTQLFPYYFNFTLTSRYIGLDFAGHVYDSSLFSASEEQKFNSKQAELNGNRWTATAVSWKDRKWRDKVVIFYLFFFFYLDARRETREVDVWIPRSKPAVRAVRRRKAICRCCFRVSYWASLWPSDERGVRFDPPLVAEGEVIHLPSLSEYRPARSFETRYFVPTVTSTGLQLT